MSKPSETTTYLKHPVAQNHSSVNCFNGIGPRCLVCKLTWRTSLCLIRAPAQMSLAPCSPAYLMLSEGKLHVCYRIFYITKARRNAYTPRYSPR